MGALGRRGVLPAGPAVRQAGLLPVRRPASWPGADRSGACGPDLLQPDFRLTSAAPVTVGLLTSGRKGAGHAEWLY